MYQPSQRASNLIRPARCGRALLRPPAAQGPTAFLVLHPLSGCVRNKKKKKGPLPAPPLYSLMPAHAPALPHATHAGSEKKNQHGPHRTTRGLQRLPPFPCSTRTETTPHRSVASPAGAVRPRRRGPPVIDVCLPHPRAAAAAPAKRPAPRLLDVQPAVLGVRHVAEHRCPEGERRE